MLGAIPANSKVVPMFEVLLEVREQRRAEESFNMGIPDKAVPWDGVTTD
jgi:hypothetical protein